jgi:uncharacterized lipoprotein YbaY
MKRATTLLALTLLAAPLWAQERPTERRSVDRGRGGSSNGGGTVRTAERRERDNDRNRGREVTRTRKVEVVRDQEREREFRRGVERDRSRGVVVRRSPRYGATVTQLPSRHRTVVYRGREYFCGDDDSFYLRINIGGAFQFVLSRPPVGVRVRYVPDDCVIYSISGRRYYVHEDVYYAEAPSLFGPTEYVVVDPPLGAWITSLPSDHRVVVIGGERLIVIGDRHYRPVYQAGTLVYVCDEIVPVRRTVIRGRVIARERIAYPPDALLTVQLLDHAGSDGRPRIVAERTIERPRDGAIDFDFDVDEGDIIDGRRYTIHASVVAGNRLIYANPTETVFDPRGRRDGVEVVIGRL